MIEVQFMTKELKSILCSDAACQAITWKNSKIYDITPSFAITGIFVNEGIFKANNLPVPTTVEKLEKVAENLKIKGLQPFAWGAKPRYAAAAIIAAAPTILLYSSATVGS